MDILRAVKQKLGLLSGDEDPEYLNDEVQDYAQIVGSSKYGDSNSNTDALERMLVDVNLGDNSSTSDGRAGSNGNIDSIKERGTLLNETQPKGIPNDKDRIYKQFGYKQFQNLLTVHNGLLDIIEDDSSGMLPGQPIARRSNFIKSDLPKFMLKHYRVPDWIYKAMRTNDINPLNLNEVLDEYNYVNRFQTLLWLEEAHQAVEMRRYDQIDVMLAKWEGFFLIPVPGLAEGRPSVMRGDKVILRCPKREGCYEAYIHEVRERDVLVKLHQSMHRRDTDGERFDLHFVSSRTPFRRCHHAIVRVSNTNNTLQPIIFPQPKNSKGPPTDSKIYFDESVELKYFIQELNQYQRKAVVNILKAQCRPAPLIVFGPCGTGKTITMVEAVLQVYARRKDFRILVCANSNACADLLARRLLEAGITKPGHLVRIMAYYRMELLVPEDIKDLTVDMDMIDIEAWTNYRIIVTTCIQAGALYDYKDRYDYIFIDEAGHASEPESMIPIGLIAKDGCVVLSGDPMQLGPGCISKVAGEFGLELSLLERLFRQPVYHRRTEGDQKVFDDRYITKLVICYRSDPRLMALNNELFYSNELKCINKTPEKWLNLLKAGSPMIFHPVYGKNIREYTNPSWFNPNEAMVCISYVTLLYSSGMKPNQLGIITPYRQQVQKLKVLFESCGLPHCKVATMEEFQGDEREVILISTVRTTSKDVSMDKKFNLGFLFSPKRFNVGITRAKWLVITVGHPEMLKMDPHWKQYIERAFKVEKPVSKITES